MVSDFVGVMGIGIMCEIDGLFVMGDIELTG